MTPLDFRNDPVFPFCGVQLTLGQLDFAFHDYLQTTNNSTVMSHGLCVSLGVKYSHTHTPHELTNQDSFTRPHPVVRVCPINDWQTSGSSPI